MDSGRLIEIPVSAEFKMFYEKSIVKRHTYKFTLTSNLISSLNIAKSLENG